MQSESVCWEEGEGAPMFILSLTRLSSDFSTEVSIFT
jgi:hypothetical protein